MSKERLEEVKTVNNDIKRLHNEFDHKQADIAKCYFYEKYGNWLIEQAELREEQVQRNLQALENINVLEGIYDRLEQQNKRYREVINNINEKAILYGVDEQVYEAIKEGIKVLEGEK